MEFGFWIGCAAQSKIQIPKSKIANMEFGKLTSIDSIDSVDFTLPPDPPGNAWVLQKTSAASGTGQLYLGATGYNMKPWVGSWYPATCKEKDFLKYYGLQFNTIEHNTTHYRIPDAATVARWAEETPADFRYCPKIPQSISHARDLGVNGGEIALFAHAIRGLGPKLGPCFLQLPPYFSTGDLTRLAQFFRVFPGDVPLAVEVRHESFFTANSSAEAFFDLLQSRNAATVITDVAGRRDVCHLRLTQPTVLIRFVGNNLHPTDYTRIQSWAQRLSQWFDQGLKAAYFFTHEPDNLLAPDLAAFCAEAFGAQMPGVVLRGPKPISLLPGQQGSLF